MSARHTRRLLAVSMVAALLAPGVAFAQTAKEQALEARVAQLEQQVQMLLQAMQKQESSIAQAQVQLDQVKVAQAPAATDDGKPKIQATPA